MNIRNLVWLCASAFVGACASHSREPAAPEAQQTPARTNAAMRTGPGAPVEPSSAPQTSSPPRAEERREPIRSTWATDPDLASTRQPASAIPAPMPPENGPARPDADDTRVNARDRGNRTLTPMDQGSSPEDLALTQKIRQGLMADHSLSFVAQNVKIITLNGRVTLRGVVKTDAEHRTIVQQAWSVAGENNVDDQIDVKK